jgi:hypothetical protein
MDKYSSICTPPDLHKKIANPGKVLFRPPFRILNLTHPISCGYSAIYVRKRSASIRRASAADAARAACEMRRDPAHPVRPLGKNAKKGPKKVEKGGEKGGKNAH